MKINVYICILIYDGIFFFIMIQLFPLPPLLNCAITFKLTFTTRARVIDTPGTKTMYLKQLRNRVRFIFAFLKKIKIKFTAWI